MNETNNQVVISLLDNVKRILRSEGVFSTKSELYLRMVSFEDEFYHVKNPPKSEQGDSKNSSQAVQPLKDSISDLKAIRNGLKMFKHIPKNQFIRDIDAVLAKLESI